MANRKGYGFRWSTSANGKACPQPLRHHVASGQNDVDDGSNSIDINVGDPVKLVSDGGVSVALTTNIVYGIVVGIAPYWDGSVMTRNTKLPNQTTWGTIESRRSFVYVVPASWGSWEVDVDDKTTATTQAAYRAFVNENVEHVVAGDTASTSADPQIDISGHATTATLGWRIVDISSTADNENFADDNVKIIVAVNESAEAARPATGSIVAGV